MSSAAWDVVIVGGGPAGIAAAVRAREASCAVLLLDDNPGLGGQIWRGVEHKGAGREAREWYQRLRSAGVTVMRGFRVLHRPEPNTLLAESRCSVREIRFSRLILCTGARERFLPFPGWTLPNVIGAGGLQALAKSGFSVNGKSVIVCGTGPLLLPVAAYLRRRGAIVRLIAEQISRSSMVRFAARLGTRPGKLLQALRLMSELQSVPYCFDSWPILAKGEHCLQSVVLKKGDRTVELECDFLACGFHLVPNTELAVLLGCELRDGIVRVDQWQHTSIPNVFCAGEASGIGGVDLSLIEGQVAGLAATRQWRKAERLFAKRERNRRFAAMLEKTFALREELRNVPRAETVVCRCEDVSLSQIANFRNWREAKLYARCGMGPCQGRVCGPATRFLFGWNFESVRPPIFAAQLKNIASPESATAERDLFQGAKQ